MGTLLQGIDHTVGHFLVTCVVGYGVVKAVDIGVVRYACDFDNGFSPAFASDIGCDGGYFLGVVLEANRGIEGSVDEGN